MTPRPPSSPDIERRRLALQDRVLPVPLTTDGTPRDLLGLVSSYLMRAVTSGRLIDSIAHVKRYLRLVEARESFTIYGARLEQANFNRSRDQPHFTREDGAWFDFLIAGRSRTGRTTELIAYSCELRFPETPPGLPRFVRYDLNLPGHANETPGLRCHIHPGHDDLQTVAPFLHPLDILDLCLYGLTWPEKLRAA
jgi:hypothetical protein